MGKNNTKSQIVLFVILAILFIINQNIDYQNININLKTSMFINIYLLNTMSMNWLIAAFLSIVYALCLTVGDNVRYVQGLIENLLLIIIARLIAIVIIYVQKFLVGRLIIGPVNFKWELVSILFMTIYSIVFFTIAFSVFRVTLKNRKMK